MLTQLNPPLPLETSKGPGLGAFRHRLRPGIRIAVGRLHGCGRRLLDGAELRGAHVIQLDARTAKARRRPRVAGFACLARRPGALSPPGLKQLKQINRLDPRPRPVRGCGRSTPSPDRRRAPRPQRAEAAGASRWRGRFGCRRRDTADRAMAPGCAPPARACAAAAVWRWDARQHAIAMMVMSRNSPPSASAAIKGPYRSASATKPAMIKNTTVAAAPSKAISPQATTPVPNPVLDLNVSSRCRSQPLIICIARTRFNGIFKGQPAGARTEMNSRMAFVSPSQCSTPLSPPGRAEEKSRGERNPQSHVGPLLEELVEAVDHGFAHRPHGIDRFQALVLRLGDHAPDVGPRLAPGGAAALRHDAGELLGELGNIVTQRQQIVLDIAPGL